MLQDKGNFKNFAQGGDNANPQSQGEPELSRAERMQIEAYRRMPKWKQIAIVWSIRAPRPVGRLILRALLLVQPKK